MQLCVYTVSCMCRNRELSDICAADQLHEERKRSFNKRRGRSSAPFQGESTGLTENTVQVFYLHVTTSHSRGMRCCMLQRSRLVSLSDKSVRKRRRFSSILSVGGYGCGSGRMNGAALRRSQEVAHRHSVPAAPSGKFPALGASLPIGRQPPHPRRGSLDWDGVGGVA